MYIQDMSRFPWRPAGVSASLRGRAAVDVEYSKGYTSYSILELWGNNRLRSNSTGNHSTNIRRYAS